MNDQLKEFVVNAPDGSSYTVNASPDATDEELIAFVQQSLQQKTPDQGAPDVTPPTPFEKTDGTYEQPTLAQRNNPKLSGAAQGLWDSGERNPDVYNQTLSKMFPDVGFKPLTKEDIEAVQRRDDYYKARKLKNPGNFISLGNTGVEDPTPPKGFIDTTVNAVQRGLGNMANNVVGLGALGADIVGADETSDALLDEYINNQAKIDFNLPRPVQSFKDIDSVGDAGLYAADTLGEFAPNITSGLVTGGLGRAVAGKVGTIAGAAANTIGQETGSIFGDTYQATGEKAPVSSIIAGIAAGSLDVITPLRVLTQIGVPAKEIQKSILKRMAKEGTKDFFLEGGTEAAQTFIEALPESVITGKSPFTQEMLDNMAEAFVRGGIGGKAAGVATGALQRGPSKPQADYTPVAIPDAKKNSKAYKTQLTEVTNGIVDHVNRVTEGWSNAPEYEVHDNFNKVQGVDNDALGVYDSNTGKIRLNSATIAEAAKKAKVSVEDITNAVVFHEGLGHYGLAQEFGAQLDDILAGWVADSSPEFKTTVQKWMDNNPDAYKGDPNRDLRAAEEVLAEWSQNGQLPVTLYDKFANTIKEYARKMGINLEFSERELRSIMGMIHDAVISGKGRDVEGNGFRYMYAGVRAVNSDKDSLKTARLSDRADPEQVRRLTGWFKGPDNMWRWEIPDNNAKIKEGVDFDSGKVKGKLVDILDHPELFENYPFLKDYKITNEPSEDSIGWHEVKSKQINLSSNKNGNYLSTLLHEVQHAIQNREDFAKGGNTRSAVKKLSEEQTNLAANRLYEYKYKLKEAAKEKYNLYKELFGDPLILEWRDAAINSNNAYKDLQIAERGDDPEATRTAHDIWTQSYVDRNALEDKVKKAYNIPEWSDNMTKKEKEAWRDIVDYVTYHPYISQPVEDILDRLELEADVTDAEYHHFTNILDYGTQKEIKKALLNNPNVSQQAYEHLLGEVEARDTEIRRGLDSESRRSIPPYSLDPRVKQGDELVIAYKEGGGSEDSRYMKPSQLEGIKMSVDEMSPDELLESDSAIDILRNITKDYEAPALTIDELRHEVEMRGQTATDLLRGKSVNVGELSRKLLMYDIAADKMNEKITTLYTKLQSGNFSVKDKDNYLKTLAQFQDLAARIFDEQGEVGRALRVIQELSFTRRRVQGIQSILEGLENVTQDPESFLKFAKEVQDQLEESKAKKQVSKIADFTANALNFPRAIMSSVDLSAPLRQGIFLIGRPEFYKALPGMFKYAFSKESYDSMMRGVKNSPYYPSMVEAGIAFSNMDGNLSHREEQFMSRWAEGIPIVRGSERAYSGFLNKLRADVFSSIMSKYDEAGTSMNAQEMKALAKYINNATGRGDLGRFNASSPLLTGLFFSPRLMASRFNLIGGALTGYSGLPAPVRKEAIRDLLSFGGVALTVTALAALGGADVEKDPRSSDFAKLRYGNTRYDILGGFGQYLTFGARLASYTADKLYNAATDGDLIDHYKSLGTGETKKYGKGSQFGQRTASDAASDFFANKFAPVSSYVHDFFRGSNAVGEDFKFGPSWENKELGSTLQRVVPMFLQDYAEVVQEEGFAKGTAMSVPAVFGVGMQTFTPKNLDPEAEVDGPDSFKMSDLEDGENDNISVKDGVVTLKGGTKKEWTRLINVYTREWMKEEMLKPEWKKMSDKEKSEVIAEVRREAKAQAKEDMVEELGL